MIKDTFAMLRRTMLAAFLLASSAACAQTYMPF